MTDNRKETPPGRKVRLLRLQITITRGEINMRRRELRKLEKRLHDAKAYL